MNMATQTQPQSKAHGAPKTFTLQGRELLLYQAGCAIGKADALAAASRDTRQIKSHMESELTKLKLVLEDGAIIDDRSRAAVAALPTLAGGLESIALNLDATANSHRQSGSQTMGQVAGMETAAEARWRPPWRAWGMLTLAVTVATLAATLLSAYAIRAEWW